MFFLKKSLGHKIDNLNFNSLKKLCKSINPDNVVCAKILVKRTM